MSQSDLPDVPVTLTRAQSREIDRLAMDRLGVPGVVLMENAGINATDVATGMLEAVEGNKVAIVCGGGNNGGDGYVIARHLHNAGRKVVVYNATDPSQLGGDAAVNYGICLRMGVKLMRCDDAQSLAEQSPHWQAADLLIDALLGTGFDASRGLKGHAAAVIDAINAAGDAKQRGGDSGGGACGGGPLVLAIDVPSGLDCDTGEGAGQAVRADATVTFVARKLGFDVDVSVQHTGEVFVAGVGVPPALLEEVRAS
ncbi:MAG: NAD(P)H-hydrate epimerase [Phycisphaeraceae bacterium]|nr:NAD(P)H-hydrate epimerase [Phycisphaeraceae bacterium]